MVELNVVDDVAVAAAEEIGAVAEAGGSLVLAGGSTPRRAYELASSADFSAARIWFGDERCVPADDSRSNFAMVEQSLLSELKNPPAGVFRIRGELEPADAAHEYAALMFEHEAEPFDLLLLGLGADGHTASLFPGKPAVEERNQLVTAVPQAGLEPFVARVSLTVPALTRARQTLFIVSGEAKAEAVARSFAAEPPQTPAGIVAAKSRGRVRVLLDAAAASGLPNR